MIFGLSNTDTIKTNLKELYIYEEILYFTYFIIDYWDV